MFILKKKELLKICIFAFAYFPIGDVPLVGVSLIKNLQIMFVNKT